MNTLPPDALGARSKPIEDGTARESAGPQQATMAEHPGLMPLLASDVVELSDMKLNAGPRVDAGVAGHGPPNNDNGVWQAIGPRVLIIRLAVVSSITKWQVLITGLLEPNGYGQSCFFMFCVIYVWCLLYLVYA